MTDRIRLDDLTDDALDALYERLEFTEAALSRIRDGLEVQVVRQTKRAAEAEAAIDRVRALRTDWLSTGAPPLGTSIARWWDKRLIELAAALDEPKEPRS